MSLGEFCAKPTESIQENQKPENGSGEQISPRPPSPAASPRDENGVRR